MLWCLVWDMPWWRVHTCALTLIPVRTLQTSNQNHCTHLAHIKAPPLIFPRKTERASLWVTIGQTAAAATIAAAAAAAALAAAAAAAAAVSSPQLFPIPLGISPQPQILLDSPNYRCREKRGNQRTNQRPHESRVTCQRSWKRFCVCGTTRRELPHHDTRVTCYTQSHVTTTATAPHAAFNRYTLTPAPQPKPPLAQRSLHA